MLRFNRENEPAHQLDGRASCNFVEEFFMLAKQLQGKQETPVHPPPFSSLTAANGGDGTLGPDNGPRIWSETSAQKTSKKRKIIHKGGHADFLGGSNPLLGCRDQAMKGRRVNVSQVPGHHQAQAQGVIMYSYVVCKHAEIEQQYVAITKHTNEILRKSMKIKQESMDHLMSALNMQTESISPQFSAQVGLSSCP